MSDTVAWVIFGVGFAVIFALSWIEVNGERDEQRHRRRQRR